MPVNLPLPRREELFPVAGVELGWAEAGIRKANRKDVLVVRIADGASVGGVFTRNRFCAAPVTVCREHLAAGAGVRALVVNTGNANAGTGDTGLKAARTTCDALAKLLGCRADQVLPFSTGVIMEPLPVDRLVAGLPAAIDTLGPDHWLEAAEAIMTTDTQPKAVSRRVDIAGQTITVTGIAKGAGMIQPNMATMLGFIATDAAVGHDTLEDMVRYVADRSFNAVTVDGDTSTNDCALVLASGASRAPAIGREGPAFDAFRGALAEAARRLADMLVRDGEGVTRIAEVRVEGARTEEEADLIARTVAESPLVKTALHGGDPNWGRILAAVGRAGTPLDVGRVSIWIGDVHVAEKGAAREYDEGTAAAAMREDPVRLRIRLEEGSASGWRWTSDLSRGYVDINAHYRS